MLSVKQAWHQAPFLLVFGMIRPGIEPQFSGPLANTLLIRPMAPFQYIIEEYASLFLPVVRRY